MSTTAPAKFMDLLKDKVTFANLATLMPDGSPQVTPVWFDYDNGRVRINTARGRRKDRNLSANAKVALSILDPANPYRYLQIRGHVVGSTEQGANAHIDSLAKKYLNKERYPFGVPGEVRVIYEIQPDSYQGNG